MILEEILSKELQRNPIFYKGAANVNKIAKTRWKREILQIFVQNIFPTLSEIPIFVWNLMSEI